MPINPQSFYQWAYADHLANANRGILAEYLVGTALGCDMTRPRREWDRHDLITPRGVTVEVKASGYVQSWPQKAPSRIVFNVGRTIGWDAQTNTCDAHPSRSSDVYVFCIHAERDRALADPLDTAQWQFIVIPTPTLDRELDTQATITLSELLRRCQCTPVGYHDLPTSFDRTI